MENLTLEAKTRTALGKQVKQLREKNKVPAVIYGHGLKSQAIEVGYLTFQKIYEKAGESTLIDLAIDNQKPVKVLIQEVQFNPVEDKYLHIDFYQVKMTEKITAEIPLKFIGESSAVKEMGGILVKNLDKLKIECLPDKLIHKLEVDISSLKNFEDAIHVQSIKVPEGITVLDKPDETIALIEAPRSEEELKALDEEVEAEIPEEEKAKEGEEKEEGTPEEEQGAEAQSEEKTDFKKEK